MKKPGRNAAPLRASAGGNPAASTNAPAAPKELRMEGVCMHFAHKKALDGVDLCFRTGECHALLGENGAGKSTAAHILSGLLAPTGGTITLDGKAAAFAGSADAISAGIVMVHQRPKLAEELNVWQNVVLATPRARRTFLLRKRRTLNELAALCEEWRIGLDFEKPVSKANAAERFYTSLLAALVKKPDFLILDEPVSVLDDAQRAVFYDALKRAASPAEAAARGFGAKALGVIFISHNIEEALELCGKISILRRGEKAVTLDNRERKLDASALAKMLFNIEENGGHSEAPRKKTLKDFLPPKVLHAKPRANEELPPQNGRGAAGTEGAHRAPRVPNLPQAQEPHSAAAQNPRVPNPPQAKEPHGAAAAQNPRVPDAPQAQGAAAFAARNLVATPKLKPHLRGASFSANYGEITLVKGEREAGLETLEDIICGMNARDYLGEVCINGEPVKPLTPRKLRALGCGIVPSDKYFRASNPALSVREILVPFADKATAARFGGERAFALSLVESQKIDIGLDEPAAHLSGGMLQRLVLARELAQKPRILVMADPLHALDAQTIAALEDSLQEAARAGAAVVILTSDTNDGLSRWDKFYSLKGGVLTCSASESSPQRARAEKPLKAFAQKLWRKA